MKFEGFDLTDPRDELDITDLVMKQRSPRCLLRVNRELAVDGFGPLRFDRAAGDNAHGNR